MKNLIYVLSLFFLTLFSSNAVAQEIYIDPTHGNDDQTGTQENPLASLAEAVKRANEFTGVGSIHIRLFPGLYLLEDKVAINPIRMMSDTATYIIEAVVMPDDEAWTPAQMPIIQSISANNSTTQFPHATGLLVSSSFVTIQGLKFLGNANPNVQYYYPISKEDPSLQALDVSQCYFIGNKESAPIQGGIWAHGPENSVSHCVFYECRNAVLFFQNVQDFSITNSIIYGAYESAFWFGPEDYPFTFTNNIISDCHYVLVGPQDLKYSSAFSNSIMANNEHQVGYWSRDQQKVVEQPKPDIQEKGIVKKGDVSLVENASEQLPEQHLHLTPQSAGHELSAGIHKQ